MEPDHRIQILKNPGIRTWRDAAVFSLQVFAVLLAVVVVLNLVGGMLGIASVADKS